MSNDSHTLTGLVANLLAMSDWIDSEQQSTILRQAATALEASRLTHAEREAIEVCIQDIRFGDVQTTLLGLLERTK